MAISVAAPTPPIAAKSPIAPTERTLQPTTPERVLVRNTNIDSRLPVGFQPVDESPMFDIPVTYNRKVSRWIKHFQGPGKRWFTTYLNRSYRYMPRMKEILKQRGLPQDLAFVAMIESGFSPHAVSTANAVGYWQFIDATGERYGLRQDWWVDERRDYIRSTEAAARYLADLYRLFDSWYLTASAYNMGENRLKRLIRRHQTRNFWALAQQPDFPVETREYIPKLIAAVLIAKMPRLYGFLDIAPQRPLLYDTAFAPGGIDLVNLAKYLGTDAQGLQQLNPALVKGFIPKGESGYWIRVPQGKRHRVNAYIQLQSTATAQNTSVMETSL
jgi:membrane-bound lytic murein transglycosylase D